jgi:transposase
MPEKEFITFIPGITIFKRIETKDFIFLHCNRKWIDTVHCPRCNGSKHRIKAHKIRRIKHALYGAKRVDLFLRNPKFNCLECNRYFFVPIPGILPRKQASEQFRAATFDLHHGGMTASKLSNMFRIGTATIERWYHDFLRYRTQELSGRQCPIVLGIDEHFFSKKDGFATTFADLKNHKVFDVVLGRSELSLRSYLKSLKGRERVRVVLMDLSETYRSIVSKYFPNAMIVADRFHVIRLLNLQFLKTWSLLDPVGRKNRGLLSLLRRHEQNLKPEQIPKLQSYFDQVPGLEPLYKFKQDLAALLLKKQCNQQQARDLIPQILWYMNECIESPWEPIKSFGQTLKSWLEPIARMWRFKKTNGITEGLHTKMEMISRRAFGFRNFKNYRLRVIALCGWDGVFPNRS